MSHNIPTPAELRSRESPELKAEREARFGTARAAALERGIAHWKREMTSARAQIRSGKYPMYDANCRKYIAECRVYINLLVVQRGEPS